MGAQQSLPAHSSWTILISHGAATISGPLMIDASTSSNGPRVEASDQLLGGGVDITLIGPGATFDLNGFSDTINSLILTGGSVTTGAGGTTSLAAT